jgi:hypothetical protein
MTSVSTTLGKFRMGNDMGLELSKVSAMDIMITAILEIFQRINIQASV